MTLQDQVQLLNQHARTLEELPRLRDDVIALRGYHAALRRDHRINFTLDLLGVPERDETPGDRVAKAAWHGAGRFFGTGRDERLERVRQQREATIERWPMAGRGGPNMQTRYVLQHAEALVAEAARDAGVSVAELTMPDDSAFARVIALSEVQVARERALVLRHLRVLGFTEHGGMALPEDRHLVPTSRLIVSAAWNKFVGDGDSEFMKSVYLKDAEWNVEHGGGGSGHGDRGRRGEDPLAFLPQPGFLRVRDEGLAF